MAVGAIACTQSDQTCVATTNAEQTQTHTHTHTSLTLFRDTYTLTQRHTQRHTQRQLQPHTHVYPTNKQTHKQKQSHIFIAAATLPSAVIEIKSSPCPLSFEYYYYYYYYGHYWDHHCVCWFPCSLQSHPCCCLDIVPLYPTVCITISSLDM